MTSSHRQRHVELKSLASLLLTTLVALSLVGTAAAAPSVTIDNPSGGETHGGTITINGTATESDANSSIANVSVYYSNDSGASWTQLNTIQNGSFSGNNWSDTWDTTTVADNTTYRIRANATNSTGAVSPNAETTDFTVDNTAPTVTNALTAPDGGETVNGTYTITWNSSNVTDNIGLATDPITLEYSTDSGSSWTNIASNEANDGSYSWSTPDEESTNARVRIIAEDEAGNTDSDSSASDFTLDNLGPTISNLQPSDGSTISSTSTTISADYSDGGSNVDQNSVVLTFDGNNETSNATVNQNSISYDTGTLSTGAHIVNLTVEDDLGNSNSSEWTFSVPSAGGDRIWDANDSSALDYTWNSSTFGGFFFSFTDGLGTESMTIHLDSDSDRDVESGDLEYSTETENVSFDRSGWGQYQVVGFMGEKYFAGYSSSTGNGPFSVDKSLLSNGALSEVLLDNDEDDNFVVGERMSLEEDYQLRVVEIDLDGNQVWLELYKSGKQVDSDIISSGSTYTYEKDLGGEEDVPVIAVNIESVFRGTESSVVTTDGAFQISEGTSDVDTGESFGEMEVGSTTSTSLEMDNEDEISLEEGETIGIFGDVGFEVADSSTLRFAPTIITEGTRVARGTVASGTKTWTVNNFEGFYYDIDEDVGTESLEVKALSGRTVQQDDLEYTTSAQEVGFEYSDWGSFEVIGFMAQKYFAGYTSDPGFTSGESVIGDGWLSEVLIDSDSSRTVYQGTSLDLQDGYELQVNQVDVDGSQALVELYKDNESVSGSTNVVGIGNTYTYEKDVEGIDDLPLIAVHVDSVFRGGESSVLIVDGVFQISEDLRDVSSGSTFGEMEVSSTTSDSLTMRNEGGDVDLDQDSEVSIMGDISFRVTDTSNLLYAPISILQGAQPSDAEPGAGEQEDQELNVTVSPDPVPVGTVAEITVLSNGSTVEGIGVSVNDVPVGSTDSEGRVLFTPNASGTFAVEASGEGYVTATTSFEASESGLFVEKPSRAVAGEAFTLRFIDEDGEPVQGVEVSLDGESIGTTGSNGTLTHTVNESGIYSLSGEGPGAGSLVTDLEVSEPASLEVVNVIVGDAVADEPTRFDVVVRNPGGSRFNGSIQMSVGDEAVETLAVSLAPGEVKTVEFSHTFGSTLFGSPAEANPRVSFAGHEVDVEVQGNSGKRNLVVLGILIVIVAVGGALVYYFGPERVQAELRRLRSQAETRVSEVRERARDRFGGDEVDEEDEPFIGGGRD